MFPKHGGFDFHKNILLKPLSEFCCALVGNWQNIFFNLLKMMEIYDILNLQKCNKSSQCFFEGSSNSSNDFNKHMFFNMKLFIVNN